jgi:pheromone shutdown protein TraB
VLIDDRNKHMAGMLDSLSTKHKNIVAVVGDGHIPGLLQSLKSAEVETIRLKDIRTGNVELKQGAVDHTVTFWYRNE